MKHKIATLCLAVLVVCSTVSAGNSKGFKYKSTEGKMSATFPAAYETVEDVAEFAKTVKTSADFGDATYLASYTLHYIELDDTEDLAAVSLDAFNSNLGGTITSQTDWVIKKSKGINAMINMVEQEATIQYKVVIRENIQYQVMVITPSSAWDQRAADAFFKSFKIK
jgi:hypothetical protein